MKVTILGGAGTVGSCAAFRIAQDGYASEILLVDIRRNIAEAHALDIDQAMVYRTNTKVWAGEIADTAGSDIIIVAVGVWGRPIALSRAENIRHNLDLLTGMVKPLTELSPQAFWIVVTTPVDALVHLLHSLFSISREKVIGINRNDTARLRWAIARVLSVPATDVQAFVLGEHGDTQVPVMSRIKIGGREFSLNAEQREQVMNKIQGFLPKWIKLQPGRTAGWATAEAIGDIITSIATDDERIWPCSTPLKGEYGLQEVSLGVPVRLGPRGVKEVIELSLDPDEKSGLAASATAIREQIKQGQTVFDDSVGALDEMLKFLKGGKGS